jgi:hypothetical protein
MKIARPIESHTLSIKALHEQDQLMSFNWMVACYAHADWLGSWAVAQAACGQTGLRVWRQASLALLKRHGLMQRYLSTVGSNAWLFLAPAGLQSVAQRLGVAMLGGWVRNTVEHDVVALQLNMLGALQRQVAMADALSLNALPFSCAGQGWPLKSTDPDGLVALGFSCLAGLLKPNTNGAHERFLMRFAKNSVAPLPLSTAQKAEALNLIQAHTAGHCLHQEFSA